MFFSIRPPSSKEPPELPEEFRHLNLLLRSTYPQVRRRTAEILGRLKDPRVVPFLLNVLHDEDLEVRKAIIAALGEIRDRRAVEPLVAMVQDINQPTRREAARALRKIGESPSPNGIEGG